MDPKVSAIVLSYNHERYIYQALEAVFQQDYTNFEIVIRDDASSDRSVEIISDFINTHIPLTENVKIKFIKGLTNTGLIKSYNDALSKSSGEILVVFSGDDISYSSRIKETVGLLIKYKVDLVSCNGRLINEKGDVISESNMSLYDKSGLAGDGYIIDQYKIIKGITVKNVNINFGGYGFTFRKRIFPSPNFLPETALVEDHIISFLSIINNGALILSKTLLDYRIHERSITRSSNVEKINQIVSNYLIRKENNAEYILNYLKQNGDNLSFDRLGVLKNINNVIFNNRFIINYCKNEITKNRLLIIKAFSNKYIGVYKTLKYSFFLFFPFHIKMKIKNYYKAMQISNPAVIQ